MRHQTHIGGVGGSSTPPHIEEMQQRIDFNLFMFKCLNNRIYRNIFYMCLIRGYFYKGEIESELLVKINTQIKTLINKGILKEIQIPQEYANYLYSQEGYNYYNVQKMKIYSFTEGISEILQDFKDYLEFYSNPDIVEKFSKEEEAKQSMEEYKEFRHKQIMRKDPRSRTMEDLIFIEEYKKNRLENWNFLPPRN